MAISHWNCFGLHTGSCKGSHSRDRTGRDVRKPRWSCMGRMCVFWIRYWTAVLSLVKQDWCTKSSWAGNRLVHNLEAFVRLRHHGRWLLPFNVCHWGIESVPQPEPGEKSWKKRSFLWLWIVLGVDELAKKRLKCNLFGHLGREAVICFLLARWEPSSFVQVSTSGWARSKSRREMQCQRKHFQVIHW